MKNLIPVEGHSNLFKDKNSGAIVNTNDIEYSQYVKIRSQRKKQKEEIEEIKNELGEIKNLLKELLNGNGPNKN